MGVGRADPMWDQESGPTDVSAYFNSNTHSACYEIKFFADNTSVNIDIAKKSIKFYTILCYKIRLISANTFTLVKC